MALEPNGIGNKWHWSQMALESNGIGAIWHWSQLSSEVNVIVDSSSHHSSPFIS